MSHVWFATPPPFLAEIPKSEQIGPPIAPQSPLGSGPVVSPATSYPGIYGGYETYLGQGPFTSASDTYYEPHLYGTGCHTPGVGTWAGIGSNVGPFGQDGTVSQNGNPNHMSFWQVWLDNVEEATAFLFSVPAGDLVRANVNYQTYNEFYGTVTNVTTGQAQGWSVPLFAGAAPNTGEAEVEKIGGYDLANFGTLTFATSTVNGNALNSYQLGEDVIQSGTSTAMTNQISGNGSFSVHQTHC